MSQTSIELEVRRDTSRKQVTECHVLPIVPITNSMDSANTERPVQTKKQILAARIQFAACCVSLFLAGWNDGTLGPLLPRIQSVYHVGFAIVSLLFVLACVGFIAGALINVPLSDKLGFGKVIVIGSLFQVVAYTLMAPALPFPALVIAYLINGIGIAMQDAQANGYVASLESNAEAKMGLLHAVYGAGALCSPLVATQFAQLQRWSFQFLVSLGLSIANTLILILVFRFKTQDECLREIGQPVPEQTSNTNNSTFRQILSHKTVHLLAFYILVYVGVEVTIGGNELHIRSISSRNEAVVHLPDTFQPASLVVSNDNNLFPFSLLSPRTRSHDRPRCTTPPDPPTHQIGERRAIFVYALLAIGLELVVWLVPSLIGGAVAVSIVGLLLGPMYPIAMNHAGRVLPRWILTGSIGWIAGFGQAGSAVLPFMTGALSSKFGIKSLQPLLVSMMGLMVIMWAIVPKGPRRAD